MQPAKTLNENGLSLSLFTDVLTNSSEIFNQLERQVVYLPADSSDCWQQAVFGDPELSLNGLKPEKWLPLTLDIKAVVEGVCGESFNFLTINRYRNGHDYVNPNHADEKEDSSICSLSLGATRQIVFSRPDDADVSLQLRHNSLLLIQPPTTQLWTHSIPKEADVSGVRVSLTFRKLEPISLKRRCLHRNTPLKRQRIGFSLDQLPENNFHLGENLFVVASDFKKMVKLHFRYYQPDGSDEYHPTTRGITITPSTWLAMSRMYEKKDLQIINCELLLVPVDDSSFRFQKVFKNSTGDYILQPSLITLNSKQLEKLRELVPEITNALCRVTVEKTFPQFIRRHDLNINSDAELGAACALLEFVCGELSKKVIELLNCFGCVQGYENQLGHDCVTTSPTTLFACHGAEAIFSWDLQSLAQKFCMDNEQLLGGVTDAIFKGLFENVRKMYVGDEKENYMYLL